MNNDKDHSQARAALAIFSLVFLIAACSPGKQGPTSAASDHDIAFTRVTAGQLDYYPAGEYLRNGYPAVPSQASVYFDHELDIATRQVSQADYARCVNEGACRPLDKAHRNDVSPNLPVVGVSWRDASAYAQWVSSKTGQHYRLPTYTEWVHAAGDAYKEDAVLEDVDINNPAQRWLAEYALETQRKTSVDGTLRPFGGFGKNDRGLLDMAGNVWEWTDTCHVREYLDATGESDVLRNENCGVRVVAGPHRSYIPDFIRDAKSGACSVGVPPSNLGFRLVRDHHARPSTGLPLRQRLGFG